VPLGLKDVCRGMTIDSIFFGQDIQDVFMRSML